MVLKPALSSSAECMQSNRGRLGVNESNALLAGALCGVPYNDNLREVAWRIGEKLRAVFTDQARALAALDSLSESASRNP